MSTSNALNLLFLCCNYLFTPVCADDNIHPEENYIWPEEHQDSTEIEVALLIGGNDDSGYAVPPEIYAGHLGDGYRINAGLDTPTLNPPFNTSWVFAGFYVPDLGIHICGSLKHNSIGTEQNENNECRLLERVDSAWTPLSLPSDIKTGLWMPSILPLAEGEGEGFLLAGEFDGLPLSFKYQPRESLPAHWTKFITFPTKISLYNSGAIHINHIKNINHLVYVICGFDGIESSIRICFCDQNENDIGCPNEKWKCLEYPYPFVDVEQTTTIRKHVDGVEMDALIIIHHPDSLSLTIRTWDFDTRSPILSIEKITGPKIRGGSLVTLKGKATYFGGLTSGGPSNAVFQYDPDTDSWTQLETSMMYPRSNGTAIVMPESWFFDQTSQSTTELTSTHPQTGICTKTDSRGILWTAYFNETIYKNCPKGYEAFNGSAFWYCDSLTRDFYPDEPDRSKCIANWLEDIQNMIDSEAPPEEVSEAIAIELNRESNTSTTGGSIIAVKNVLEILLHKHSAQGTGDFSENIINSTSVILQSFLGWKEISDENKKHELISDYLKNLDYAGFIWAEGEMQESECNSEKIFNTESVSLVTKTVKSTTDEFLCFSFESSGSICYPESKLVEICNVLVATSVQTKIDMKSEDSFLFPAVKEFNMKGLLGQTLIGLTINNNTGISNISGAKASINFHHEDLYHNTEGCLLVPRSPTCIYWNTETSSWSTEGCEVISSSMEETVCSCNHLTNFGIVLDWEGKAPANDHVLDITSLILLICSSVAVLLTELLLSLQKKDFQRLKWRVAERNRNLSLFCAQLLFIVLVGQFRTVNCTACEIFGALTHLFWLNFFLWTAIQGYLVYTNLVNVFEKAGTMCLWKYYLIGYGVSSIIVLTTVIISVITNSYLYLRRDLEGRVNSCWLHSYGMLSILIPVGIVVVINSLITVIAVIVTYRKGPKSRSAMFKCRIILALRNIVLLSFFFGSTWLVGFLPYSRIQQFVTVILNASLGFYILNYSVLSNKDVRDNLKNRLTELWPYSLQQDQTQDKETKISPKRSAPLTGRLQLEQWDQAMPYSFA